MAFSSRFLRSVPTCWRSLPVRASAYRILGSDGKDSASMGTLRPMEADAFMVWAGERSVFHPVDHGGSMASACAPGFW
jgi:hypothetical protein